MKKIETFEESWAGVIIGGLSLPVAYFFFMAILSLKAGY